MRKFFIIISGIYVLLTGVILLAPLAAVMLSPKQAEMASMARNTSMAVSLIFSVYLMTTGVGIFLKKNWARISLLIIASVVAFSGIFMLLARFMALPAFKPALSPSDQGLKLFVILLTAVIFVFIPAFFLIFFNRKSVKDIFTPAGSYKSPIPLGIKLIAVALGLGAILAPLMVYYWYPRGAPLFFGITMSKSVTLIYTLILSIVDIYIAIGFFRLNKKAWVVAICRHIYSLLIIIVQSFTFRQEQLDALASQYKDYSQYLSLAQYRFFNLLGAGFILAVLIYLFSKKSVFYQNKISAQ